MPTFIPDPSSTIHDSSQACIILHYIHISHHTIHPQTNIIHPRIDRHPNSGLPCPTPRSGWKVSLRRDVLAQANLLRLGEGSKREAGAHAGSRLGENPLAWARCSLAQKAELVAWATFRTKVLGELPVHLA